MKELQNLKTSNDNKLLVVLPVNKIEDFLLNECLYSLAQQEYSIDLIILAKGLSEDDMSKLEAIASAPKISVQKKNDKGEVLYEIVNAMKDVNYAIVNSSSDTFSKCFNEGLNYAIQKNYEWFSIVEHDDVIDTKWYQNFTNYQKEKNDVDGFMPLTREISNGIFLGYFNEAPWVEGFAEKAGMFDLALLSRFNCMNITGAVFKTESIKKFSLYNKEENYYRVLKESIRMDYIYEFFLRMLYKDLKFFSVPRISYEHRVDRPASSVDYFASKLPRDLANLSKENGGMTLAEISFWRNLVKKEFYHDKDRNIQYSEA